MTLSTPAGELDRQITLRARQVARDAAYGTEVVTWADVATGVWARVRERVAESSGDEVVSQGLRVAQPKITVTMRWLAGVETTMQLVLDDGRAMQITSMATMGRRELITLACEQWREG